MASVARPAIAAQAKIEKVLRITVLCASSSIVSKVADSRNLNIQWRHAAANTLGEEEARSFAACLRGLLRSKTLMGRKEALNREVRKKEPRRTRRGTVLARRQDFKPLSVW
jgi:hypothetical protein